MRPCGLQSPGWHNPSLGTRWSHLRPSNDVASDSAELAFRRSCSTMISTNVSTISLVKNSSVVKRRPLRQTLGCCYSWWPLTSCRSFSDVETQSACRRSWQLEPDEVNFDDLIRARRPTISISEFCLHSPCFGDLYFSVWILVAITHSV